MRLRLKACMLVSGGVLGTRMGTFVNRVPRFFRAAGGGEGSFSAPLPRRSISWAAQVAGEGSRVMAEAAGGGGRRPAFTRLPSPTTIAWRDRGAESLSVRGSLLRPALGPVEARRAFSTAKTALLSA